MGVVMSADDEPCLGCDEPQHLCRCTRQPSPHRSAEPRALVFSYTNTKGKTEERRVIDVRTFQGPRLPYYRDDRWLLEGYDLDRREVRLFDLQKVVRH
jgi:hypothetical protein